MIWVEYPGCGDRTIVILDGRQSLRTWIEDGHWFNGWCRPFYPSFRIMRGERLIDMHPVCLAECRAEHHRRTRYRCERHTFRTYEAANEWRSIHSPGASILEKVDGLPSHVI